MAKGTVAGKRMIKKIEKGCPESRFWAWNILATARTMREIVLTISPAASSGCHSGTPPTTNHLTIVKGAVSRNKHRCTEQAKDPAAFDGKAYVSNRLWSAKRLGEVRDIHN